MNRNLKTYALLGLVLTVWGIIGFRVVKALSPKPKTAATLTPTTPYVEPLGKRDTFALMADYRDPFLGTFPSTKVKSTRAPVPKKTMPKRNIAYSGMVSQIGSGSALFFVSIDGQAHIMSKNQKIDGVSLISGNEGSIRVRYNGIAQTIARSE